MIHLRSIFLALVFISTSIAQGADETTLLRIKADPSKYVSKYFILNGTIEVDDYYNYSFRELEEKAHSFRFREINNGTFEIGEWCHLYLSRTNSEGIINEIIYQEEQKEGIRKRPVLVRVEATLPEAAYAEDKQWNMFILSDIQFYDHKKKEWEPWYFDDLIQKAKAKNAERAEEVKAQKRQVLDDQKEVAEARWRTWTDSKGKKFKAQYGGLNSGNVKLILEDKSTVKVPFDKLTQEEKDWINQKAWIKKKPAPKSKGTSNGKK